MNASLCVKQSSTGKNILASHKAGLNRFGMAIRVFLCNTSWEIDRDSIRHTALPDHKSPHFSPVSSSISYSKHLLSFPALFLQCLPHLLITCLDRDAYISSLFCFLPADPATCERKSLSVNPDHSDSQSIQFGQLFLAPQSAPDGSLSPNMFFSGRASFMQTWLADKVPWH